jgi:hypothetical protein
MSITIFQTGQKTKRMHRVILISGQSNKKATEHGYAREILKQLTPTAPNTMYHYPLMETSTLHPIAVRDSVIMISTGVNLSTADIQYRPIWDLR